MPEILWTYRLAASPGGVALARESGHILAWDLNRWLVLLNGRGRLQAQTRHPSGIVAAAVAEDGSGVAVADDRGTVAWLAPDFRARWRHTLDHRPTALALDALGRAVAVADTAGRVHLFGAGGRRPWPAVAAARPLCHLAFAPAAPVLFGTADYGLVTALDVGQRRWTWQDAPVVHLGGLAAAVHPAAAVVSCYSEGLRRYSPAGDQLPPVRTPEPCRHVATDAAGRRFLTGGVSGGVHLLRDDGSADVAERMDQPVAGLALAARAECAVVALTDGRVIGLGFD
jgi:hypothetical protein